MSFFATFVLVFVLIFRPQEIWPFLEAFRLLDVLTGLAALGVGIELLTGRLKNLYTPQLPWLAAFVFVSYFSSTIVLGRQGLTLATTRSLIAAVFMLVIMYGARTVGRMRALVALLAALYIGISAVAIHQGNVESLCIELPPNEDEGAENGHVDGRSCELASDCRKNGRYDVDYVCERLGLFKTVSVQRRVRWRGQLGDPNELAVFIGAMIPLILALTLWWKRRIVLIAAWLAIGIGLYVVVLTQSRGGQLVVASIFGTWFIGRFGWKKGLVAAAVVALPVILLGGRVGEGAASSSEERMSLLFDGITTFTRHPILGIGIDQFNDVHRQTAHNAYLLAATELGGPGFVIWSLLVWSSVKIPLTIARDPPEGLDPNIRALAGALVTSFIGMALGIFFLSFTFKQLLFIWLGMAGAMYGMVRDAHADFRVKLGARDYIGIIAFDAVMIAAIYVYTRLNPA